MRTFFVILIVLYMLLGLSFSSFAEIQCNKEAGYTEIKNNKCYNPKTLLSYQNGRFYYNDKYCGDDCDFEGRNCRYGICNAADCAKGYTFKLVNNEYMCNNSKLSLSYTKNDSKNKFYYNDEYCGINCDFEGRNCRYGICNAADCAKGYTLKLVNNEYMCNNSKLSLSYIKNITDYSENKFYYDDEYCGDDCDYEGKKCRRGVCNASACVKGYTSIKKGKCYNPQTLLSYEKNEFYYDGLPCGEGCNYEGKNCTYGICNVDSCDNGYTQLKKGKFKDSTFPSNKTGGPDIFVCLVNAFEHNETIRTGSAEHLACYNPNLNIAYFKEARWNKSNISKVFSVDNEVCGINCDSEGKNCEVGLCNVESCPKGYKILYHGACKSENGDKVLVYVSKDKLIKFHHPSTIAAKEKAKTATNVVLSAGAAVLIVVAFPIFFIASLF